MSLFRIFLIFILGVSIVCSVLLVVDRRILVWEHLVGKGMAAEVPGWGKQGEGSLICWYFTGRSLRPTIFNFSANNILGRDQCPFVIPGGE